MKMNIVFAGLLAAALVASSLAQDNASATQGAGSGGRYDQQIQQAATAALAKEKRFAAVKAATEDGIVTLTGSVPLFADKEEAAHKVHKVQHLGGVINKVEVSTTASDSVRI